VDVASLEAAVRIAKGSTRRHTAVAEESVCQKVRL